MSVSSLNAPTTNSDNLSRVRVPVSERALLVGDFAVRQALHRKVLQNHWKTPDTVVINELAICHGFARVDIAVVNGELHGFEIKSQLDSVARLAHQSNVYGATLDRMTLVTHKKHLAHAMKELPDWWGIKLAVQGAHGRIQFKTIRRSNRNPGILPMALVEFLWRSEALLALEEKGAAKNFRGKSKQQIYEHLLEVFTLDELRALVRQNLKRRQVAQSV